jgi:hypothetical protein
MRCPVDYLTHTTKRNRGHNIISLQRNLNMLNCMHPKWNPQRGPLWGKRLYSFVIEMAR